MRNIENQALYQGATHSPDKVMNFALRFFTDRTHSGQWNKLSPDKEQILALTAELKNLKTAGQQGSRGNRKRKGKDGQKDGSKKERRIPKWKKKPPASGESHTKTVNNKTVHWCPKHKLWVAHRPDECKGIGSGATNNSTRSNDTDSNNSSSGGSNRQSRQGTSNSGGGSNQRNTNHQQNRIRLQQALQAIVEASSQDEESDE